MSSVSQFMKTSAGIAEQVFYTSSGSFTAPVDGNYCISATGGGAATNTSTQRGGCGAGYAQKWIKLKAGDVVSFTVGAGGATNGASGGNTTVTAPGMSLVANGGTSTAGGTASGGDINVVGGVSGAAAGSGGGGVGVYGVGYGSAASSGSGGGGTGEAGTAAKGGAAAPGITMSVGFANGRLVRPMGNGGTFSPYVTPGPGGGGIANNNSGTAPGGMFAGGGGGSFNGPGGVGGGGAGGGANLQTGGVGIVIIEFARA